LTYIPWVVWYIYVVEFFDRAMEGAMRLEELIDIDEDDEFFDDQDLDVITQRGDMRLVDLFDDAVKQAA